MSHEIPAGLGEAGQALHAKMTAELPNGVEYDSALHAVAALRTDIAYLENYQTGAAILQDPNRHDVRYRPIPARPCHAATAVPPERATGAGRPAGAGR